MELETYLDKYLPTLYLQHRSKMTAPINKRELVQRVREGITEDTGILLPTSEVEAHINARVPREWRCFSPKEADAQWYREVQRKEVKHGGEGRSLQDASRGLQQASG